MSVITPAAAAPRANRALLLHELLETMGRSSSPPPAAPPPDPAEVAAALGAAAQLPEAAATSAVNIAQAVAALGMDDGESDEAKAAVIWQESLAQIARIQRLYGLPPLPFQSQPLPPGQTA